MTNTVINNLKELVPEVRFCFGESFYWSPENKIITYNKDLVNKPLGLWALFHEVAHANLNHINYSSDLGLLKLEVEAWERAKILSKKFNIKIDDDHIQDCLDTYRDWLYRRSTCPSCGVVCLQRSPSSYQCHNCLTNWTVSASRFCRPYRRTIKIAHKKRLQTKVTTFS